MKQVRKKQNKSSEENFFAETESSSGLEYRNEKPQDTAAELILQYIESLKVTTSELNKLKKKVSDSTAKSETTSKDVERLVKETQNNRLQIIEILGIFVALFTFVSIDIQVLNANVSLLSTIGFVLITLGSLLFFVLLLRLSLRWGTEYVQSWREVVLVLVAILVLVSGTGLVYIDSKAVLVTEQKHSSDIEDVSGKILEQDIKFSDFKKCLANGGWANCLQ